MLLITGDGLYSTDNPRQQQGSSLFRQDQDSRNRKRIRTFRSPPVVRTVDTTAQSLRKVSVQTTFVLFVHAWTAVTHFRTAGEAIDGGDGFPNRHLQHWCRGSHGSTWGCLFCP
jgi:hypothetical protein